MVPALGKGFLALLLVSMPVILLVWQEEEKYHLKIHLMSHCWPRAYFLQCWKCGHQAQTAGQISLTMFVSYP